MARRFPVLKASTHEVITLGDHRFTPEAPRATSPGNRTGIHGYYIDHKKTPHTLRMPESTRTSALSMQDSKHARHIGATRDDVHALYGLPLLRGESGISYSLARNYLNKLTRPGRETVDDLAPVIAENLADIEQPDHRENDNTTGTAIASLLILVITTVAFVTGMIAGFATGVLVLLLDALPISWMFISTIRSNLRFWKGQVDPIVESLSYIEDEITLIDAADVPELVIAHHKLAVAELTVCIDHADTALIEHRNTLDEIWHHYEDLTTHLAHFDDSAGTATKLEENAAISAAATAIRERIDTLLEQINRHDSHLQRVEKQHQKIERQAREDVTEITSQHARDSIRRIAEDLGTPTGEHITNINPTGT